MRVEQGRKFIRKNAFVSRTRSTKKSAKENDRKSTVEIERQP